MADVVKWLAGIRRIARFVRESCRDISRLVPTPTLVISRQLQTLRIRGLPYLFLRRTGLKIEGYNWKGEA